MSNAALPPVPTLNARPADNAAAIVAGARAHMGRLAPEGTTGPLPKKPSGAYYRKLKRAKATGAPLPARPGAPAVVEAPPLPPIVEAAPVVTAPPAAAPAVLPEPAAPAPLPDSRLTAADLDRLTADERAAAAQREGQERRQLMLTGDGLAKLEKRVGRAAQIAFTVAGVLLGDDRNVWPLTVAQQEEVAILLCEAWPDEMAELMQDGALAKVLAIGTIGQIVRDKWTRHRTGPVAVVPPPAAPPAAPTRPLPGVDALKQMTG